MQDIDELRLQLNKLQSDKDAIQGQLDTARRLARAEGIFADREWLRSAETARRAKGRQIQQLQIALGKAIKAERAENYAAHEVKDVSFVRRFIHVARAILPTSQYEMLLNATRAAVEADEHSQLKELA
jgi:hypothetical protein